MYRDNNSEIKNDINHMQVRGNFVDNVDENSGFKLRC